MGTRSDALVDEGNDHRAFANGGSDPLGRPTPRVADRVDARDARLENPLRADLVAGENEAVLVAHRRVAQPVGVRLGAQEEEEVVEREAFAVHESDPAELAVLTVQLSDLASVAHLHTRL